MSNIILSSGVRQNLLSLQNTSGLLDQTQTRLSTGKKVNSALDNPTNYFTASSLSTRAGDLSELLDSINIAVKTLEASDKGLTSLQAMLRSTQAAARQAIQTPSTTAKLISSTTYASTSDLVGGAGTFDGGETLAITVGSGSPVTITFGTSPYKMSDLINSINTDAGLAGKATAYLNDAGKLVIESITGENLKADFTDTGATPNTLSSLFGSGVTVGAVTATVATTINTTRKNLADQYDLLKSQVDQLVQDTGYNGVNLLNGDSLKLILNESNTSSITVVGQKLDSNSLGFASTDTANKFQSDQEIQAALSKLDTALTTIRNQASSFGANLNIVKNREDFTKNMIQVLESGSDTLTAADTNEEGANLLALRTRQQLGVQALSLASQSDQAILRLF